VKGLSKAETNRIVALLLGEVQFRASCVLDTYHGPEDHAEGVVQIEQDLRTIAKLVGIDPADLSFVEQ
jgi:hypothetical protein